eukprot:8268-Pelagomonas_calceolata.AAC.7
MLTWVVCPARGLARPHSLEVWALLPFSDPSSCLPASFPTVVPRLVPTVVLFSRVHGPPGLCAQRSCT